MEALGIDSILQLNMQNSFKEVRSLSTLVTNGSVDYIGRVADKETTGSWKACTFIIVNKMVERLAFFGIAVNMVAYLVSEMHQRLPDAVTHVTNWIGAAHILTLLGAFLADAYLGRFFTIIIFSCIYLVGMMLLTVSASVDSLRPPTCTKRPYCTPASIGQTAFLFAALWLIALGSGCLRPCVSSFGSDQFDREDEKESEKRHAFFNWFFFGVNMGSLLGISVLVFLQDQISWAWGFLIPTFATAFSILVLAAGFTKYRYQKPMGSPFTRFLQVIVASLRNHFNGVRLESESFLYEVQSKEYDLIFGATKLNHTQQYRFLDKAAVKTDPELKHNPWRLCTVTQVEELKSFIRVLPVWASTIPFFISYAQLSTFFISQADMMDRSIGRHFTIPSRSVPVFAAINGLILVSLYEKLIFPFLLTKTGGRCYPLQRMGIGLLMSIFSMATAATVESMRRHHSSLTIFWLFPQFFLMGAAEVFMYVGQLEFFSDESTPGTRSINSSMYLCQVGIGSWLSTALVKTVEAATGGVDKGWLRDDLNHSKLHYFYSLLTVINALNFLVYFWVAWRFNGRDGARVGSLESFTDHQDNKFHLPSP